MAKGKLYDTNLALTATLSGGTWSAALPLSNLKKEERYIAAPARCEDATDLAKSRFDVTLENPRVVDLVALLFHTISLSANYRITLAGLGETLDEAANVSEWSSVYGRLYDSASLPWEAANWWTGQVTQEEVDLVPRHLWISIEETLVSAIRIEIDDQTHPDGEFDIGGLLIGAGFAAEINYERGRDLTLISRDLHDETPSGRVITEPRSGRRQLAVNYAMLDTVEAYRWFDAALRARTGGVVFFIPDVDDEPSRIREAFPATFERPPGLKLIYATQNTTAATFKEILA